jgi:hypothetical protein
MKRYNIYDMQTNEIIGQVTASNVDAAEYKACEIFNKGSLEIYALTSTEEEERAQETAELINEIVKLEYELNNKKAELAGLLATE